MTDRRAIVAMSLAGWVVAPWVSGWLSPVCAVPVGVLALQAWSRKVAPDDRNFVRLITGVFLAHAVFAAVLFLISYFQLPVLRTLQLGGGFWAFAGDSDGYHGRALQLVRAFTEGLGLPPRQPSVIYESLLASVYLYFGPLPLTPILINCWLVAATGLLVYQMMTDLGATPANRYAAVIFVTCWPSGFIWSSQLLRDSSALFLTFAALMLSVSTLKWTASLNLSLARKALMLTGATAAATSVRIYVGWILLAGSLIIALGALLNVKRKEPRHGSPIVVLLSILVGAAVGTGSRVLGSFDDIVNTAVAIRVVSVSPASAGPQDATPTVRPSGLAVVPLMFEQKRRELRRGSNSVVGANADLSTWRGLLSYLPVGLLTSMLAPFPWDWHFGSTTGIFKLLALVESVTFLFLLPALMFGLSHWTRSRSSTTSFVLCYGAAMLAFLSLLIPNLGGLVRLRAQGVLPLLTVAIAEGGLNHYARPVRVVIRMLSRITRRGRCNPQESVFPRFG